MGTGVRRLALAAAVLALACSARSSTAAADIAYAPCGDTNHFACGHLVVPLDPAGGAAATLTLALRRHRAPVGQPRSAIVALAGGPGQPALPLAEQFAEVLGPLAGTRDLIVFDQRGVGLSQPLACHAFERPDTFRSLGALVHACGVQLGSTRTLYGTGDSVADIEAIRRAGGYDRLLLYGTSYGTKVAEEYAQAHPEHVEGLVLDSVVAPDGPDPLDRSTFAAVPRVLRALCAGRACAGVTRDPVADLAGLLARSRSGRLSGRAVDGAGRGHRVAITPDAIFDVLLDGDFAPALRAEFVTAARVAARGDAAPIARLLALAAAAAGGEREDFDSPLYYATLCEEQAFPWNRGADARTRLREAGAFAAALPVPTFAPFTAATAIDFSDMPACAGWPYTGPLGPPAAAPLPGVPTLVLSGAEDLRTPTADAAAMASRIPGSHLLVVPETGHSVLGADPTSCSADALRALFGGRPVERCREPSARLRPPPLPPARLALVSPAPRYRGRTGRTLHAVTLSLADLARQLALRLALEDALGSSLRVGGLRGGWASVGGAGLVLHGYCYVPGVTVSGTIVAGGAHLVIAGAAAAAGTLRLAGHDTLAGTLGGTRVSVVASTHARVAIVRHDARASSADGRRGAARRELAGLLGAIPGGGLGP